MARYYRKRQRRKEDPFFEFFYFVSTLYFFVILLFWFTDRDAFWRWVVYGIVFLVLLFVGIFFFFKIKKEARRKKIERMTRAIKEVGLTDYIDNFISNFGLAKQEPRQRSWNYRDYSISWDRIGDLIRFLKEKGISFYKEDLCLLLENRIDEREYRKMTESQDSVTKNFKDLSGTDFENLLYRLYEKMDYTVQRSGKSGDQGGDLVIAKKGNRIVVQAKRYQNLVNNKAIQEAVAAKRIYNCKGSTVVTTSDFTDGALELAKANNVYLINGKKLKELLLYYLKENWI